MASVAISFSFLFMMWVWLAGRQKVRGQIVEADCCAHRRERRSHEWNGRSSGRVLAWSHGLQGSPSVRCTAGGGGGAGDFTSGRTQMCQ